MNIDLNDPIQLIGIASILFAIFCGGTIYASQKRETATPVRSGCALEKDKQENRHSSEHRSSIFTRHAQIDT